MNSDEPVFSPSLGWRFYALVLLAACLLTLVFLSLNWTDLIDDAYIFFRYAVNLNQGQGYVFNPGEWVEGTTSVSWTLLLALLDRLAVPLFIAAKLLGTLCILSILILLAREFFRLGVHPVIMGLVFALLILDKNFVLSIMMGLETGLYALLLLGLYLVARRYARGHGRRHTLTLALVSLLLFLTRPESLALLALVALMIVLLHVRHPGRYPLLPLLIGGAGLLLVTGWRVALFGDWLPNSVQAKSVLGFVLEDPHLLVPRAMAGIAYIRSFVLDSLPLFLLGLSGVLICHRRFETVVAAAALMTGMAVVLLNSGDWMPFARLLTPLLPLLALSAGIVMQKIAAYGSVRTRQSVYGGLAVATVLLVATGFWMIRDRAFFVAHPWPPALCYRATGLALENRLSAHDVVAAEALGEIGYILRDTRFLDMFGLTEPFIARHGTIPLETFTLGKHHYGYVMAQRPSLFLFHSPINNHIPFLVERGYPDHYDTFRISDPDAECELVVGLLRDDVPRLRPPLEERFIVEDIDARAVPPSGATWPQGNR